MYRFRTKYKNDISASSYITLVSCILWNLSISLFYYYIYTQHSLMILFMHGESEVLSYFHSWYWWISILSLCLCLSSTLPSVLLNVYQSYQTFLINQTFLFQFFALFPFIFYFTCSFLSLQHWFAHFSILLKIRSRSFIVSLSSLLTSV